MISILLVLLIGGSSAHGEKQGVNSFTLSSSEFSNSGPIPAKYTTDGIDVSPPLSWTNVPDGTQSFVLIMEDPDAVPVAGFVWDHWIVYDIPSGTKALKENAGNSGNKNLPQAARHGTNSWGVDHYRGPAPPSGTHKYYFKLYAINVPALKPSGKRKTDIEKAMIGKILGQASFIGTYNR
jgi:Raf kinase inhibitor-like YbhB/YbcL family protein